MKITTDLITQLEATLEPTHTADLAVIVGQLERDGLEPDHVIEAIGSFSVAAPSWAVGTGGTRFGRFPGGGEPRTIEEKIDDVAALTALTGANRTVSLHVPWDDPVDREGLRIYAAEAEIGFDAINSNTFQDNPQTTSSGAISFKFGSMSHPDPAVRHAAVQHNLYCIDLGDSLGSRALTVWLGDGMNHPGQADFRTQYERVAECLAEIHDSLPSGWQLFTEHKPYEPAFYSSVNADWGTSLLLAQAAGEHARCLVDLGHHLPNTNIEQVISRLNMVGRLGGFHFNDSKYGDDDLTVGSIRPYQLFLVLVELLKAGDGNLPDLSYMIDASHNIKDPLEDMIQATDQIQFSLAQAHLVSLSDLRSAQDETDAVGAAEILQRAYRTDVRPLVAEARRRNGAALRPIETFRATQYRSKMIAERGSDTRATGL